jgi:hypothetical protein
LNQLAAWNERAEALLSALVDPTLAGGLLVAMQSSKQFTGWLGELQYMGAGFKAEGAIEAIAIHNGYVIATMKAPVDAALDGWVLLGPETAGAQDLAALSVGLHELGHAVQGLEKFTPYVWAGRLSRVPTSSVGLITAHAGIMLGNPVLAGAGVVLIVPGMLRSVLTLITEWNASARALRFAGMLGASPATLSYMRTFLGWAAGAYAARAFWIIAAGTAYALWIPQATRRDGSKGDQSFGQKFLYARPPSLFESMTGEKWGRPDSPGQTER